MLRTKILALACLSALTLSGCSGNAADTPSGGTNSGPAAGGGADTKTVSAKALCDYLTGELPNLKSVGSEVGAMAQLTIGLADFFDKNGKLADGSAMDDLTTKECPSVRTDTLKAIGKGSFAEL